jgi:hypothetical protein
MKPVRIVAIATLFAVLFLSSFARADWPLCSGQTSYQLYDNDFYLFGTGWKTGDYVYVEIGSGENVPTTKWWADSQQVTVLGDGTWSAYFHIPCNGVPAYYDVTDYTVDCWTRWITIDQSTCNY